MPTTKQPYDAFPMPVKDRAAGTVTSTTATTHYVDVSVQLVPQDIGAEDDIVLRVNGYTVKRLKKWQAERLDLLIRPIPGSETY